MQQILQHSTFQKNCLWIDGFEEASTSYKSATMHKEQYDQEQLWAMDPTVGYKLSMGGPVNRTQHIAIPEDD